MGEGRGRWGPGPEQPPSRNSGSEVLPVAPLAQHPSARSLQYLLYFLASSVPSL